MSGDGTALEPLVGVGQRAPRSGDDGPGHDPDGPGLAGTVRWLERHGLVLAGVLIVGVGLVIRAHFLSGLYFRQDDFRLLDRAYANPLDWSELTFIGAGHLIPGPYLVAWLVTRVSLYDYGLACAVSLAFAAAAALALLRLLRALFGDRPGILIPLACYVLCPLTMPDLGIWSSALESVPLQLAVFSAVHAQVRYVRTGRKQDLASGVFWVAFGLFFFEKGLVLPPLLFAITSGFLMGSGPWRARVRACAARYWRAWLAYLALLAVYSVVLKVSLRTSVSQPGSPGSVGNVLTFVSELLRDTLVPGIVGGPWHWFPIPDRSYAVAAPGSLAWIAMIVLVLAIGASVLRARFAWRAWATFGLWLVLADIVPVVIGRLGGYSAQVLGLESRYVADSVAVLAICIGLALWPVRPAAEPRASDARSGVPAARPGPGQPAAAQFARTVVALATGVFLVSSLWSIQAYESVTTGAPARAYIANATLAVQQAPARSVVVSGEVPAFIEIGDFGKWARTSTVIGDIARAEPAARLRWVSVPSGTFNKLMTFGPDGRLYLARVAGVASPPRPAGSNCWAARGGRIAVPFSAAGSAFTTVLRIGYYWNSPSPVRVTVRYGSQVRQVRFEPGLHGAYLPVGGPADRVVISGYGSAAPCVGDAEAGNLVPWTTRPAIPAWLP